MESVEVLLKKVIEERRQQEIAYHKERVAKLINEKIELELRLAVLNEALKQITEFTANNPLFKE